jgi:hypothetical protein
MRAVVFAPLAEAVVLLLAAMLRLPALLNP